MRFKNICSVLLSITLLFPFSFQLMAHGHKRNQDYKLTDFLVSYPKLEQLKSIKKLNGDTIALFTAQSSDKIKKIQEFYKTKSNLKSWTIVSVNPNMIMLSRPDEEMYIFFSSKAGKTWLKFQVNAFDC